MKAVHVRVCYVDVIKKAKKKKIYIYIEEKVLKIMIIK